MTILSLTEVPSGQCDVGDEQTLIPDGVRSAPVRSPSEKQTRDFDQSTVGEQGQVYSINKV